MNEGFRSITVFLALIIGAQEFEWTDTSYAAYWGTPVVTYSAGEFPDRMPGTDRYTPYARSRVYCHEGGRAVIYLRNGEPESVRLEESRTRLIAGITAWWTALQAILCRRSVLRSISATIPRSGTLRRLSGREG